MSIKNQYKAYHSADDWCCVDGFWLYIRYTVKSTVYRSRNLYSLPVFPMLWGRLFNMHALPWVQPVSVPLYLSEEVASCTDRLISLWGSLTVRSIVDATDLGTAVYISRGDQ